jgi:hypothetical protein
MGSFGKTVIGFVRGGGPSPRFSARRSWFRIVKEHRARGSVLNIIGSGRDRVPAIFEVRMYGRLRPQDACTLRVRLGQPLSDAHPARLE